MHPDTEHPTPEPIIEHLRYRRLSSPLPHKSPLPGGRLKGAYASLRDRPKGRPVTRPPARRNLAPARSKEEEWTGTAHQPRPNPRKPSVFHL